MNMWVIQNGEQLKVALGVVKGVGETSVVLEIKGEPVVVQVAMPTALKVARMLEAAGIMLLPVHIETLSLLLDVDIPEVKLEELEGAEFSEEVV
ncbi:hypothetical protein H7992_05165 [Sporosarcina sp. resist]|uniref:hypothetical protein n=1 Tax=Sporosarcina sp. resist TaxID=2762563 RepID=UPI00164E61BE|nr:hypothetical protein [Sporosarcina sp. resist]QNK89116.1 hypothetical protein H7992_05165 [Sporosarcina sp. resist]